MSLKDRRSRRQKIFEPFLLVDHAGERRAHLLDISETGGLVHCEHRFEQGDAVDLKIHGRSLRGQVAWVALRRFGVTFSTPLSASMIHEIMQPS